MRYHQRWVGLGSSACHGQPGEVHNVTLGVQLILHSTGVATEHEGNGRHVANAEMPVVGDDVEHAARTGILGVEVRRKGSQPHRHAERGSEVGQRHHRTMPSRTYAKLHPASCPRVWR